MVKRKYLWEEAYKARVGVANSVLVMLEIGLLCETIGKFINCPAFVGIGTIAKAMLAPAIGAGIAYHLGGNTLIIFSAMIAASVGGNAAHVTSSCIVFV